VNEDQDARARMRTLFLEKGVISCKVLPDKADAGIKYKDYYEWEEGVATAPSHRILAMRRGEREEFLTLRMTPPEEEALRILDDMFVKGSNEAAGQGRLAVHDS